MNTAASGTTIVSAQVPVEVKNELERLAREGDRSLSAEVRRAVTRHLERDKEATLETSRP